MIDAPAQNRDRISNVVQNRNVAENSCDQQKQKFTSRVAKHASTDTTTLSANKATKSAELSYDSRFHESERVDVRNEVSAHLIRANHLHHLRNIRHTV